MFDFCKSCGAVEQSGQGYLVKEGNSAPKFYADYKQISPASLANANLSLLKVNRSNIEAQVNQLKDKAFTDPEFPPNQSSLGPVESVQLDRWKRVSELLDKPQLYGHQVQHNQATAGGPESSLALRAAAACLAEQDKLVHAIFGEQKYSKNGAYTLLLRFKGEVQEVVIDDYVPVDDKSQPLFCRPSGNSVWMMLVEKALAKLYGSYGRMKQSVGSARVCLQHLTLAPALDVPHQSQQSLWTSVLQGVRSGRPVLGHSSGSSDLSWATLGLTPNHYYSVLQAAVLSHKLGSTFRVVKLRNAFRQEEYQGEGSASDHLFWEQVEPDDEKSRFLSLVGPKEGILYMLFSDYLKYFDSTIVCQTMANTKFYSEQLVFEEGEQKHGLVFRVQVEREGDYLFTVDQNDMQTSSLEEREDGWSRTTLLLARDHSAKSISDYEFLDGLLRYNQQHATLLASLPPGNYLLYVKLEPTLGQQTFPSRARLVVYSSQAVHLRQESRSQSPDLLRLMFLGQARSNKRQFYNNDLMWSSWRLVSQGGYGYLAYGNSGESKAKFVVKLDKEILLKENYAVKHPASQEVIQTIEVLPGQEQILLLRVCNSDVKEINFPPPLDIQIRPL